MFNRRFGLMGGGPPPQKTIKFTSSGTWKVPQGVYYVQVQVAGGGGGGGKSASHTCRKLYQEGEYFSAAGGRGGNGATASQLVRVAPFQTCTLTVGGGGGIGATGGTTTFSGNGATLSAAGGGGGGAATSYDKTVTVSHGDTSTVHYNSAGASGASAGNGQGGAGGGSNSSGASGWVSLTFGAGVHA